MARLLFRLYNECMDGPRQIGPYEVIDELGRGGLGVVYRARNPRTGGQVAVKVLLAPTSNLLQRFEIEARAAASLSHPNLVRVHDLGQDRGRPYMVMELVEGQPLDQKLKGGPLTELEAVELAGGIAAGLAEAHGQGLLHRDVKPGNVIVDRHGVPRLTDFGLARQLEAGGLTQTGVTLGTPAYMSPEQADDAAHVDGKSDVYALGATLFEMLTGQPPFGRGGSVASQLKAVLTQVAPPPRSLRPDLDKRLNQLCVQCLARDPRARPTMAELHEELRGLLGALQPGASSPASVAAAPSQRGPVLAAAIVVAGGLIAASLVLTRREPQPQATPLASATPTRVETTPEPTPEPSAQPSPSPSPSPSLSPSPDESAAPPPTPSVEPSPSAAPPTQRERVARQLALLFAQRRREDYARLLGQALQEAPHDALWQCAARYGGVDRAPWVENLPYAEALLEQGLETPWAHKLVGGFLIKTNSDPARGVELLEEAFRRDPEVFGVDDSFFHVYGEGVNEAYRDSPEERVARFGWSIGANRADLGPNRHWHYFFLAGAHRELEQWDLAEQVVLEVYQLSRGYPQTSLYVAEHYRLAGDLARARELYQEAEALAQEVVDRFPEGDGFRNECLSVLRSARSNLSKLERE